ncbi:MAG: hypothetical protein M1821_005388 [Bathelium mastoideum]|nr:MAG: hypothetical protein M1821_005388 [Bathelium mastoideum]KAI9688065.1 MAG: hypothetical protein M1822_001570 [Bathelium mastoideum]
MPSGRPPTNTSRQTTAAGFPAVPRFRYSNGRPACMTVTGVQVYKVAPNRAKPTVPPKLNSSPELTASSPQQSCRLHASDAESREIYRLRAEHAAPWMSIAASLNAARRARNELTVLTDAAVYTRSILMNTPDILSIAAEPASVGLVETEEVEERLRQRSLPAQGKAPTIASVRKAQEMRGWAWAPVEVHWSTLDDQELVDAYRECVGVMWEKVAERLGQRTGRVFSGEQCRRRFEAL